jgi:metallo-beta-lactamase family protein
MKISFLGAAGTVTGSKYLLEIAGKRLLIDCGLFQGRKELRLRNWRPPPVDPANLDAVILTHAHLDHSGYLPVLIRSGYRGPIYCTEGTKDLCGILLPDSGYLMERDAEYANRKGFSKHHPAEPLYNQREAEQTLKYLRAVEFNADFKLGEDLTFRPQPAGHILGAATITLIWRKEKIVFSGDLGRPNTATMVDPVKIPEADYLICESTYGDRLHDRSDPEEALQAVINETVSRGGSVIIPSFAVGRSQTLLYHIWRLKMTNRIAGDLPVFLDSPMAINASELFCKHHKIHKLSDETARAACGVATYVRESEDSKKLDTSKMPMVLISASGMATGGRILHHLKHFAPDRRNTILFVGFQAEGTRGDRIVRGEKEVKIHGQMVPIRAEVRRLEMFSAHADQSEIMDWLGGFRSPPRLAFITHGEAEASATLAEKITHDLGWATMVPKLGDTRRLD